MTAYYLITIGSLSLITIFLRAVPFLFPKRVIEHPKIILLSTYLPPAIMFALVLYCFMGEHKEASTMFPFVTAATVVSLLHWWKRNALVSISVGTALYCILKNF